MFPTTATVTVLQGVGDVFWVYQKLKPLYSKIKFKVIDLNNSPSVIAHRSYAFIRTWPGVVGVEPRPTEATESTRWITDRIPLRDALPEQARIALKHNTMLSPYMGDHEFTWSANAWVNEGYPLERIDKDLPVSWAVPLVTEPLNLPAQGYLLVYVCGETTRHKTLGEKVWPAENWMRLVDRICYNSGVGTTLPLVFCGAIYDYPVLQQIADQLRNSGFKTQVLVDLPPVQLYWLLKYARAFVGYQSGLNILADNLGVAQQLIVYYPSLKAMRNAWVRPDQRTKDRFNWGYFDETPDDVAMRLALKPKEDGQ